MGNAFGPEHSQAIRNKGWKVQWQDECPPANDTPADDFSGYPGTDFKGQRIDLINASTWDRGHADHFLWVPRGPTGGAQKPNNIYPTIAHPDDGNDCRILYSTMDKAIAACKVQVMYTAGYPAAEYEPIATAAGFSVSDIIPQATLAADPAAYFTGTQTVAGVTYRTVTDKIYLQIGRIADSLVQTMRGIFLDWEVADNRTGAQALELVQFAKEKAAAKGYTLSVYTNSLTANTANGWDQGIIAEVMNTVYRFATVAYSGQAGDMLAQWEADKAYVAGGGYPYDPQKHIPTIAMAEPFEDLQRFRAHMEQTGAREFVHFRDSLGPGGEWSLDRQKRVGVVALGINSGKGSAGAARGLGF